MTQSKQHKIMHNSKMSIVLMQRLELKQSINNYPEQSTLKIYTTLVGLLV